MARSRFEWVRESISSAGSERRRLERAKSHGAFLSERIDAIAPDVLFGCCISSMLFALTTDVPIVYFSDATARIINETYPTYRARSRAYKRVCDAYERATMERVSFAAFASELARRSAIDDYGLRRDRSRVVPMGAHITPACMHIGETTAGCDPPSRADLRLCVVASDPRRKRVRLAVQTAKELRRLGWNATLTHIGRPCRGVTRSRWVRTLGPLRLSSPDDRAAMAQALAESHLLLLPSVGEAYGIAPCEAAHFGRPSVVSAAGGLPEVVDHGRAGLVLPVSATAQTYADSIARLCTEPGRYETMSRHARARARKQLTWSSWSAGIIPLLRQVVAEEAPVVSVRPLRFATAGG